MQPRNADYRRKVHDLFYKANFIADLGVKLVDLGPGWCETTLDIAPRHLQQDNFIHAGVQATMADHSAGGAGGSLIAGEEVVLTVEFKVNLLRPAVGEALHCRATVLRPGRTIIIVESEVYTLSGATRKLTAKATVTLAVVNRQRLNQSET